MKNKKALSLDLENIMPLLVGIWRRFHKLNGPQETLQTREFRSVVAGVQALQKGLESGDALVGTDYFANPEWLGAYLLYQWVVHYQQGMSLINEIPVAPQRVLDIGSGPGAFAFAALRHGAQEVIATDISLRALTLASEVCGRYGMPLSIRQWNCLRPPLPEKGEFDLITIGHCLTELFPSTSRNWVEHQNNYIAMLLEKLTPNGFLLLAESSLPEANKRLLSLRDHLVRAGVPVQAPCVWKGDCPALKTPNSPCYAQREFEKPYIVKEIQRAAQINLSSLKMSYLILKSPKAAWPALPKSSLFRIISPPVDTYQGKRYYLCGTEGKKSLGSHLKVHPPESRAFEFVRRGELISLENALVKDGAIDIVEGTKLVVEAACGKPLPEAIPKDPWDA